MGDSGASATKLAHIVHPELIALRNSAEKVVAELRDRLQALQPATLVTVAAAGSVGRLECGPKADCDCLLIAREGVDSRALAIEIEAVLRAIETCGLEPPKVDGIYRQAVTREDLLAASARGSLQEPPAIFGKRMQVLLDARALHAPGTFDALRHDVLDWYTGGAGPSGWPWQHLLRDIARYQHTYAVWQHFKLTRSADDSWALRQVKLRSVRRVTFAGLVFLIGASLGRHRPVEWLLSCLDLTPLERIAAAVADQDSAGLDALVSAYAAVLAAVGNVDRRAAMVACGPDEQTGLTVSTFETPELADLEPALETIEVSLRELLLNRRGYWPDRFFSTLLF